MPSARPNRFWTCVYRNLPQHRDKPADLRDTTHPQYDWITRSEAERMQKKVKGMPLLYDHNPERKIGRISDSRIDENHDWHIEFELDSQDGLGVITELIRHKRLSTVSLGHDPLHMFVHHLSLGPDPVRPGTSIYNHDLTKEAEALIEASKTSEQKKSNKGTKDAVCLEQSATSNSRSAHKEPAFSRTSPCLISSVTLDAMSAPQDSQHKSDASQHQSNHSNNQEPKTGADEAAAAAPLSAHPLAGSQGGLGTRSYDPSTKRIANPPSLPAQTEAGQRLTKIAYDNLNAPRSEQTTQALKDIIYHPDLPADTRREMIKYLDTLNTRIDDESSERKREQEEKESYRKQLETQRLDNERMQEELRQFRKAREAENLLIVDLVKGLPATQDENQALSDKEIERIKQGQISTSDESFKRLVMCSRTARQRQEQQAKNGPFDDYSRMQDFQRISRHIDDRHSSATNPRLVDNSSNKRRYDDIHASTASVSYSSQPAAARYPSFIHPEVANLLASSGDAGTSMMPSQWGARSVRQF